MTTEDTSSRVVVKTYVSNHQKEIWERHAEELGMSMSEFLRTMVQSGRQPFDPPEDQSSDENPRGNDLKTVILDILETRNASWDELYDAVAGDIEEQLDETLGELQQNGKIIHSGKTNEYRKLVK